MFIWSFQVLSGEQVEAQFCGRKTRRARGSPILEELHVPYNSLTILFQSDFSNEERYTGFAAYYTAIGKSLAVRGKRSGPHMMFQLDWFITNPAFAQEFTQLLLARLD